MIHNGTVRVEDGHTNRTVVVIRTIHANPAMLKTNDLPERILCTLQKTAEFRQSLS
jgi:hypothetical protein